MLNLNRIWIQKQGDFLSNQPSSCWLPLSSSSRSRGKYGTFSHAIEFLNEDGSDSHIKTIEANYKYVKQEILSLVASEIERIKNDTKLKHLVKD